MRSISVTNTSTQIVDKPLILECSVTTLKGITIRMDMVWRDKYGSQLKRVDRIKVKSVLNDSYLFVESFTIPRLTTTDDGRLYQCEVVINSNPLFVATTNITLQLDFAGKLCLCIAFNTYIPIQCNFMWLASIYLISKYFHLQALLLQFVYYHLVQ